MIVEFFGPPGVGKTTFAIALGARLDQSGCSNRVYLSSRPGEERENAKGPVDSARIRCRALSDPLRRIGRPGVQLLLAVAAGDRMRDPIIQAMLAKLPHGSRVASLRVRQYLVRLSAAWREAQSSERVAIFDQGYVQAIASILIAGERTHDEDFTDLIAIAPRADLVIKVDAPILVVESRLRHRARAIGRIGRLFESKLGGPVAYAHVVERMQTGLRRDGRAMIDVGSADAEGLLGGVERVHEEIERVRWLEESM